MKVSRPAGVLWNSSADLHGGHHDTASGDRRRKMWTRQENEFVMECYLRSGPERRRYRKRMHDIWRSKGIFEVTEQRLMDQIRQIKKNKWLSNLEIENIKRRIEEEVVGQGWNACKRGG